jgi:hypothetical protein
MPGSFDFVSTEDKPALIAFSTPEWLQEAKTALQELGYTSPHRRHAQRFPGALQPGALSGGRHRGTCLARTPEENLTLKALQNMPVNQRRHATIILLGNSFQTFTPWKPSSKASTPSSTAPKCSCSSSSSKSRGRQRALPPQLPRGPKSPVHLRQSLVMPAGS